MKLKKLLAVVLAVVLCASMLAVPAFAGAPTVSTVTTAFSGFDALQSGLNDTLTASLSAFTNVNEAVWDDTLSEGAGELAALLASMDITASASDITVTANPATFAAAVNAGSAVMTFTYKGGSAQKSGKTFAESMAPYWEPADIAFADALQQYNDVHDIDLTKEEFWNRIYWKTAPAASATAANAANPNNYTHEQQLAANDAFTKAVQAYQADAAAQNAAFVAALTAAAK